jgi:hypothetical protein
MPVKSKARAAVITVDNRGEVSYAMYDVLSVDEDRAQLAGPLLLEPGEAVTVELSLPEGRRLRVEARVCTVLEGGEPGIEIQFSNQSHPQVLHGRND